MKAIIIEDEAIAVEVLRKMIRERLPAVEIVAVLHTIDESVRWINTHPLPDVAFVDIHLADGSSFAIFNECRFECPIIFTTAYDQYAIRAFEVNSVGYLLKPIDSEKLCKAIEKIKPAHGDDNQRLIESLLISMRQANATYLQNILITKQDKLLPLSVSDIAYFCIEGRQVNATTYAGKTHRVTMTLDELQERLNPHKFFRVNRQYIVHHCAVKELTQWFNSKYVLGLLMSTPEKIIIPKAKVTPLKEWLAMGE